MNIRLVIASIVILIIALIVITPKAKYKVPAKLPEVTVEGENTVFVLAPEFSLPDIDGKDRRLSDFKGKVIILNFWATWCPPCRIEIPHFIKLYDKYKDDGLEIIGVSLDHNAGRVVSPFVSDNDINYTVLLGDDAITDLYGGIDAVPTTFLLDRDGRIRKKYLGYRRKEVFEEAIKGLFQEGRE